MDEEITALEAKLTELVNAVSSLRHENNEIKPSVEKLQEENRILKSIQKWIFMFFAKNVREPLFFKEQFQ